MDITGDDTECFCWLCTGRQELHLLDEYDTTMLRNVRERGWSVVGVHPEHERPGWVYSVGLWHSMRSPEICMFGLELQGHGGVDQRARRADPRGQATTRG